MCGQSRALANSLMMALSRSLTTLRGTFCTVRESLKELAHCRDRVIDAGDHSWHCHEHRISYRTWRHSAPRATDSVARAVAGGAQQEQGDCCRDVALYMSSYLLLELPC